MNKVINKTIEQNRHNSDSGLKKIILGSGGTKSAERPSLKIYNVEEKWKVWGLVLIGLVIYKFIDKSVLDGVIKHSLPLEEASLLSGIILGQKEGISKELYQQLINSGLVHLVVASGSNVMLLTGGGIELFSRFLGRKKTTLFFLGLGWFYAIWIVGSEIPVIRAMILVTVLYGAQLTGRKYNLIRSLILSTLIIVLGEVKAVFSVSFWLSMMAYLGTVTASYFELKLRVGRRKIKITTFWETLMVSIFVTPILGVVFGKISLVSPLTNMLVIGVVEVVTIVGIIGVGLGQIYFELGRMLMWLTIPGLNFIKLVASNFDKGVVTINFNFLMALGWYLVLARVLLKIRKSRNEIHKS